MHTYLLPYLLSGRGNIYLELRGTLYMIPNVSEQTLE